MVVSIGGGIGLFGIIHLGRSGQTVMVDADPHRLRTACLRTKTVLFGLSKQMVFVVSGVNGEHAINSNGVNFGLGDPVCGRVGYGRGYFSGNRGG